MKTQDTKNWRNVVISVTALLAVLFPMLGKAGPMGEAGPLVGKNCLHVTTRPLSDFLDAQGTTSLFFPPVQDMLGWTDAVNPKTELPTTFGLVDYAGLANEYIKGTTGHPLGTKVRGLVVECKLANGKAQITVALFTTRALGFAQSVAALAGK